MGKLTGGPYYDLIGRTGNNVGRRVKGKNIFSMRPAKSNRPPSPKLLAQQLIMGELFVIMGWIVKLVKVGFKDYTATMNATNAATAYNYDHAVVGVSPNQTVDFTKLVYSRGKTDEPFNGTAAAVAGAKVVFTWLDSAEGEYSKDNDLATLVIYNEDRKTFMFLQGIVQRSALTYTFQLPSSFVGNSVYAYMSFVSAEGKPGMTKFLATLEVV